MLTTQHIAANSLRDNASAGVRARIERLTMEMGSGRTSDAGRALASDFSEVSRVVHGLRTLETRAAALSGAEMWLEGGQAGLDAVARSSERLDETLQVALAPGDTPQFDQAAGVARAALTDMASALSQTHDGRAVFGNGSADGASPVDLEVLLAETAAIAAAAPDAETMIRDLEAYFAPGGNVERGALGDFPADPAVFPLGDGDAISMPFSAREDAVRSVLLTASIVASLPQAGFALTGADVETLRAEMSARGVGDRADVATLQGRMGAVQSRVADRVEGLEAARLTLEGQKNDMLAADPYETATRLQEAMTKLETLYAITARRSRLNLTEFLR
ncbi:hypothetical protein MWU52_16005 [Jannaschia sp. S6380]|uniref:flagellin n=1 Tax=Jannaschia sp. S6380 TaxID=2926408 RepID=UPI001FF68F3D|nr:flagellin [Jannaschia sp. S6380]MCK0169059.1 hypothetical protein [Jannaschia sp. S6380]